eukprot:m.265788 g.265788  ORF g.265788 m.265788 type:complete len:50 (+) comp40493_c2_seq16:1138-1287(+)
MQGLPFGHININSLLKKLDSLRCITNVGSFPALAISDSKIDNTITILSP